jgi:hypothetical protein
LLLEVEVMAGFASTICTGLMAFPRERTETVPVVGRIDGNRLRRKETINRRQHVAVLEIHDHGGSADGIYGDSDVLERVRSCGGEPQLVESNSIICEVDGVHGIVEKTERREIAGAWICK